MQFTIEQLKPFAGDRGGVEGRAIDTLEAALDVKFPADVRTLAGVFRGGRIGEGFEHFSFSPDDPLNVLERTHHFRTLGLPLGAVALAMSGRELRAMVFHTTHPMIFGYLLDEADGRRVRQQRVRQKYSASFFSYRGFLLDRLEALKYEPVREAMIERFPKLTRRAAAQWRHRWQPQEARRIEEILGRGIRATDNLPTHEVDGKQYIDLRGYLPVYEYRGPTRDFPPPPSPPVWFERVDFSFSAGSFFAMHARDCLFRGAQITSVRGRFHHCDFTMLDCARANLPGMGAEFVDCNFTGAYLAKCSLRGRYERCDFTAADLSCAPIDMKGDGGSVIDCTFTDARVSGDFGPWGGLKYGFSLDSSDTPS